MTLPHETSIGQALIHLKLIAPAGFALALHLESMAPRLMFVTYPAAWQARYAQAGMLLSDPTIRWSRGHLGTLRWEDIPAAEDPARVMQSAAEHGLAHGVSFSIEDDTRSLAGMARADRGFTDDEIDAARAEFTRLHRLTREIAPLDAALRARLQRLSAELSES